MGVRRDCHEEGRKEGSWSEGGVQESRRPKDQAWQKAGKGKAERQGGKGMRGVRRTVAVLEQDGVARRVDLLRPQRHVVELRARVQLQPVKPAHTILAGVLDFREDCNNNRADHL